MTPGTKPTEYYRDRYGLHPIFTTLAASIPIEDAEEYYDSETVEAALAEIAEDLDTHAGLTNPHSATAAATADRLVLRDASGRAAVAAPSAEGDAATKGYVDGLANFHGLTELTEPAAADEIHTYDADGSAYKRVALSVLLAYLDAATSRVFAHYYATGFTPAINAQLNFDTEVEDTHDAVTTGASWKFTAPLAGLYQITAWGKDASSRYAHNLYLNNSGVTYGGAPVRMLYRDDYDSESFSTFILRLAASDYIDLRAAANDSAVDYAHIQILRVGA